MSVLIQAAEVIEQNGRCFEINQEGGFIREVSCPNPAADLITVGLVVGLGLVWWYGYGPGARRRREEQEEQEGHRRRMLQEDGPVASSRKPAAPVSPMTPGQRVLNTMTVSRGFFETDPGRTAMTLRTWVEKGAIDEAALKEAAVMLEKFPIENPPYLASSWSRSEASIARRIIIDFLNEIDSRDVPERDA